MAHTHTAPDPSGVKRPAEDDDNENDIKRIQLSPVPPKDTDFVRRKRRKFALLLSYSGKGYLGMQRNPGYRTIEDDLLTAMLRADLVTEEGCTCPQLFNFQRAARTDKGVSAARQVVSIKLPEDVEDIVGAVNQHLPSQIRVMAARRTTKSFNCKGWCDSRTYSYMAPSFAFAPLDEMTREDYRITPEVLADLRETLKMYKGTHNFHNFTARKKPTDASANRYIMEVDCSDPVEREGLEWLTIKIKGQSFMMHQIRKMVGLVMAMSRGLAGRDVIEKAWQKERVDLPIAPGLGLVLEEPHYDKYNAKYGNDGIHVSLDWSGQAEEIQVFREKYIDSSIVATEKEEKSMLKWLATLPFHTFDVRDPAAYDTEQPLRKQTALGRAAYYLSNNQKAESEDEMEDEDEGDLEQYRVHPGQGNDGAKVENGEGKECRENGTGAGQAVKQE